MVEINDIVLCKMRGYCLWPAMVTGLKNGLVSIQFFGDHTTHTAAIKNFFKFEDSSDFILALLKGRKNPLLAKSIREAELALGIPRENSLLNQIKGYDAANL